MARLTLTTSLRPALTCIVFAGLIWTTRTADADAITITTTSDSVSGDGLCSLREAIIAANTDLGVDACPAGAGADTISLPAGLYTLTLPGRGEYLSATGDLDISADLTLVGAGAATTTIDGAGLDRVLEIQAGAAAQISGVTIAYGDGDVEDGGGVYVNGGQLTLTSSVVRDNHGQNGGGVRVARTYFKTLFRVSIAQAR